MAVPFQLQSRLRRRKRALRDAINQRLTLTPEQVKQAVAEYDALSKTVAGLTAQSIKWTTQETLPSPREVDAIMKRADELTARGRVISAHPQVRAAHLAMQAKA